MNTEKIFKSTQEQAVAAWTGYLNQIRIERLFEAFSDISIDENINLENAIQTINSTLTTIKTDIIEKGKGIGGKTGIHGYIAEAAECGIENAREKIEGNLEDVCEWIMDNSKDDLKRGDTYLQLKFSASGNHLSLQAIQNHFDKYPGYLDGHRKYMIPSDHYKKIKYLLDMPKEKADKMPTSTGEFSLRQWKEVHEFFEKGDIKFEDIEPSALDYKDVQRETYKVSLNAEKHRLKERNQERIDERKQSVYEGNKSTIQEAGKATVISAAVEGTSAFVTCIIKKIKSGKNIKDFTNEDWEEIAKETGVGTVKGGVRGASIYAVTSAVMSKAPSFYDAGICKEALVTYNKTASTTANAVVTASFGFAEQVHKFRKNEITELELLENSQIVCLDASVSALSSLIGQIAIPVPVLGAVIGNAVGTMMYQIAKDNFNKKEQAIIKQYYDDLIQVDNMLDEKYKQFVFDLSKSFEEFLTILENAFSPDINAALDGSIQLAKACGVDESEILDTKEKAMAYFLD